MEQKVKVNRLDIIVIVKFQKELITLKTITKYYFIAKRKFI